MTWVTEKNPQLFQNWGSSDKTGENPRSLENMPKEKRYGNINLALQFYAAVEWGI